MALRRSVICLGKLNSLPLSSMQQSSRQGVSQEVDGYEHPLGAALSDGNRLAAVP
jgi:hypothetical protein